MQTKHAVSGPFHIVVRGARDRAVVIPHGELDLATVGQLEREIQDLRSQGIATLVLDLRQLTFMDSTGLRLLLCLDAAAESSGHSFAIVDSEGPVRRLLTVTHLRDRFDHAEGLTRPGGSAAAGGCFSPPRHGDADSPTTEEHSMSDGTADTAKGRVKKAAGDLTGNDDLKREGDVDQAAGKVKEKVGDAADKVKDALRRDDD